MSERFLTIAFIISLAGHGLLCGIPACGPAQVPAIEPEETMVNIEVEEPVLVPPIDKVEDEKHFKNSDETPPQEDLPDTPDEAPAEAAPPEPVREKVEVFDASREATLRYQDAVKRRIQEARRYPSWAKRQGMEGVVTIGFIVFAAGGCGDIAVIDSSGSEMLDAEAAQTVRRAGPFPRFPPDMRRQSLRMRIALVYSLRR